MKLHTPNEVEARLLLENPATFAGLVVREESLPPAFLLEAAIATGADPWVMPRLFCDHASGEIVGSAVFKTAPRERRIEIGYGIAPACRGCGYATAGVSLMVEYALASNLVDEVLAEASPANSASRRVLEKCGFASYGAAESDEGPVTLWKRRQEA